MTPDVIHYLNVGLLVLLVPLFVVTGITFIRQERRRNREYRAVIEDGGETP